jgi:hypothetical protein
VYKKDLVHEHKVVTHEDLICPVADAVTLVSDRDYLCCITHYVVTWANMRTEAEGRQFEHLLEQRMSRPSKITYKHLVSSLVTNKCVCHIQATLMFPTDSYVTTEKRIHVDTTFFTQHHLSNNPLKS